MHFLRGLAGQAGLLLPACRIVEGRNRGEDDLDLLEMERAPRALAGSSRRREAAFSGFAPRASQQRLGEGGTKEGAHLTSRLQLELGREIQPTRGWQGPLEVDPAPDRRTVASNLRDHPGPNAPPAVLCRVLERKARLDRTILGLLQVAIGGQGAINRGLKAQPLNGARRFGLSDEGEKEPDRYRCGAAPAG
jgi:hypothetical protein